MSTQLAIANPQETDAQATLTFETATGAADAARRRRPGALAPDGRPEHGAGARRARRSRRASSRTSELALDRLISLNAARCGGQPRNRGRPAVDDVVLRRRLDGRSAWSSSTWCRTRVRRAARVRGPLPAAERRGAGRPHLHRRGRQPRDHLGRSRGSGAGGDRRGGGDHVGRRRADRRRAQPLPAARRARRRRAAATPAPASRRRPPGGSSKARRATTRRGCSSPTRASKPPQVQRDAISAPTAAA